MSRTRKMLIALGAVAALLFAAGCSVGRTEPDQAGLHYSSGHYSPTSFSNCITPSSRVTNGPGDKYFNYPVGQRTYDFSNAPDAEAGPINIVSKDNVELHIEGGLTFQLDTSCDPIKIGSVQYKGGMLEAFHERIGLKYKAYMDGDNFSNGWIDALRFYMGKPLVNAMQTAAQKYDWRDLYNDPAVRVAFENEVKSVLPASVSAQTGGQDYFNNFNLIVQKPEPPKNLVDQLNAIQAAKLQNQAVQQQNIKVQTELAQIRSLVKALGPYGYILYKCVTDKDANCPDVLPVPAGSNINIGK
jgi:hypothetical protein